jgi:SnoaL-like domain
MNTISNPTPTLETLLAVEACREAARRYSHGVDRLDPDTMRSAYWPDGTDDHGTFVGNAHDFVEHCMTGHTRWAWTMHSIFNHRVEISGDGRTGRGEVYNVTNLMRTDERVLDTWYGRYLDEYEQRDGEWRILHRVCVHEGDTAQAVPDGMPIDAAAFRQGAFDRPANGRRLGP